MIIANGFKIYFKKLVEDDFPLFLHFGPFYIFASVILSLRLTFPSYYLGSLFTEQALMWHRYLQEGTSTAAGTG